MRGLERASEPIYPGNRTRAPAPDRISVSQRRHLETLYERASAFKDTHLRPKPKNAYVSEIINVQSLVNVRAMESQRRRRQISGSLNERIVINVCGDRFETHQTTLELFPNTLLGNHKRRQYYYDKKQKEYFFDRNRACFEAILYYYQSNGRIRRPNYVPLDTFLEEVTFFDLGSEALNQIHKDENLKEVKKVSLPRNRIRRYIWATMEYPEYSWIAKVVNILSLIMILISILGLAVETLPQFVNVVDIDCQNEYRILNSSILVNLTDNNITVRRSKAAGHVCSAYFNDPFFIIQSVCVCFFTIELFLRLMSTPSILALIKNPMLWIDFIAVVPYYILLGIYLTGRQNNINSNAYVGLKFLRIIRFARVFKFYRTFKSFKSLRVLTSTIKESIPDFLIMISILSLLAFLFGAGTYFAENGDNNGHFDSILMATYWGIITITTVGYGDMAPITPTGRALACLCALFGTATTGMLVSVLVDRYQRVYSRKLYINEQEIDFEDYTNDDNDENDSQRNSGQLSRTNSKIENPDVRAKINEAFENNEITSESETPEALVKNPLGRHDSGVRFIVGYIENPEEETSQDLLVKINSLVAEKRTADNGMTLSLVSDCPLNEPLSPDVEFHVATSDDDDDNSEIFTEITPGTDNRKKGNVLKCFRRQSSLLENYQPVLPLKTDHSSTI